MHQSLASIHSYTEQQQAASACMAYASDQDDVPFSCWLGFVDLGQEGGFVWLDGSSVSFVDWSPGEPNDAGSGEDAVEMDFRASRGNFGGWNDASNADDYRAFPICGTRNQMMRACASGDLRAGMMTFGLQKPESRRLCRASP